MNDTVQYLCEAYPVIAELDSAHGTFLVQNRYSKKLFVKKVLTRYSLPVFQYLKEHPVDNMPTVIDFAEADGTLTVIEEYIHGDTLQYRLDNRGTLAENEAASIALQLCAILRQLHSAVPPIVHRDIKPDNIILTPEGTVKLLDMNAARQITGDRPRDTQLLGTAGFAAPEQYGFQQSDTQTDIYSLGVLLNYMVTGDFPNLRMARGDLAPVIRRCTKMSPKERFSDVLQLESALRQLLAAPKAEKPVRSWQRFLPPGFRALNPGKIVGFAALYISGLSIIFTMKTTDTSVKALVANRVVTSLLFLFYILFNGNYLGIQTKCPGLDCSSRLVRCLLIFLYDAAVLVLAVMTTVLLEK